MIKQQPLVLAAALGAALVSNAARAGECPAERNKFIHAPPPCSRRGARDLSLLANSRSQDACTFESRPPHTKAAGLRAGDRRLGYEAARARGRGAAPPLPARNDALASVAAAKSVLAEMNTELNAEREVRERMAAVITPRDLSGAKQKIVEERLSPFKGMGVDIFVFGDTREITDFARKIAETLQLSGWQSQTWFVVNGAALGVAGVPIFARKGGSDESSAAATALEVVLAEQSISAKRFDDFTDPKPPGVGMTGPPWDITKAADMRIFVGAKP
jgi:hypothetical protein